MENETFEYNSLNKYLKNRFGRKVYKLAVKLGTTCPNRDGTKGAGGCIFCSESGSGEFAQNGETVKKQIEDAKERIKNKVPENVGYICYFQSFTNTYLPINVMRKAFFEAINEKDVVAISIGTRPDCIDGECLDLIKELVKIKPVWIELGFQTSNEKTAEYINRCYSNEVFVSCVKKLKEVGAEVIAHIILGLPGETVQDGINSVKFACAQNIDGIKLQLLHVLKNTKLAQTDYEPLSMEEYFSWLEECVKVIPKNVVIHRLTGDGDKKLLIKPMWSAYKHKVLNEMNKRLKNVKQGSAL